MNTLLGLNIWITFDVLFNKMNKYLETDLTYTFQMISYFYIFFNIKNLCSEISIVDPDEPIYNVYIKYYIIHNIWKNIFLMLYLFKNRFKLSLIKLKKSSYFNDSFKLCSEMKMLFLQIRERIIAKIKRRMIILITSQHLLWIIILKKRSSVIGVAS